MKNETRKTGLEKRNLKVPEKRNLKNGNRWRLETLFLKRWLVKTDKVKDSKAQLF
jgi:hypothetical protein